MGQGVLGQIVEGMDVGVEAPLPLFPVGTVSVELMLSSRCAVSDWLNSLIQLTDVVEHMLERGIVYEDVDSPHGLHCSVYDLLAVFLGAQIDSQTVAIAPSLLDLFFGLLGVRLFLRQVDDEARCAFHGEQNSRGAADSGITASDNGSSSFQLPGGLVCLVAAVVCREPCRLRLWVFHLRL